MICFREQIVAYQKQQNSAGFNVHDHLKNLDVCELKKVQEKESLPFDVGLLSIEGDLNVSVMIRTACVMGVRKVHLLGRRKYDQRGTVGAQNYIPIEKLNALTEDKTEIDVNVVVDYFVQNHLYPIFVEQGGIELGSKECEIKIIDMVKNVWQMNKNSYPLLVMGNESSGIPENLIILSKMNIFPVLHISIPQRGVLRSLNVSSAFSIVCWEFKKILGWI